LKLSQITYKIANEDERIAARRFIHDKYLEAGYFSEPYPSGIYDDHYVDKSVYFVALDPKGDIVGTLRIIHNSAEKDLPVLRDFKLYPQMKNKIDSIKSQEVVEVGNLSAIPGRGITIGLFKQAFKYSLDKGYKYWIAGIDMNVFNMIKKRYRYINFIQLGDPKYYIGSISIPIMLKINDIWLYS